MQHIFVRDLYRLIQNHEGTKTELPQRFGCGFTEFSRTGHDFDASYQSIFPDQCLQRYSPPGPVFFELLRDSSPARV
jgi:hypothetical protein